MQMLNDFLNTIIGSSIGIYIGHVLWRIWDFKTEPEFYAMQSAPWYTSILLYGVVTFIEVLVCVVIKAIIKHKQKN